VIRFEKKKKKSGGGVVVGGCSGTVPDQGYLHVNVKSKKTLNQGKKGRMTGSTATPTYGGFRRSELDTAAGSDRRIFFVRGKGVLFDEGPKQAICTSMQNVKTQKRQKKANQ